MRTGRKFAILVLLLAVCLLLAGCGSQDPVRTDRVEVASDLYSQEDINKAIDAATAYMTRHGGGAQIIQIAYAGDDVNRDWQDKAEKYQADELIVLTSDLKIGSSGDITLETGRSSSRENILWVLARTGGGDWMPVQHTY
jgi:outer membrane biogenesis lipoprotein LolB